MPFANSITLDLSTARDREQLDISGDSVWCTADDTSLSLRFFHTQDQSKGVLISDGFSLSGLNFDKPLITHAAQTGSLTLHYLTYYLPSFDLEEILRQFEDIPPSVPFVPGIVRPYVKRAFRPQLPRLAAILGGRKACTAARIIDVGLGSFGSNIGTVYVKRVSDDGIIGTSKIASWNSGEIYLTWEYSGAIGDGVSVPAYAEIRPCGAGPASYLKAYFTYTGSKEYFEGAISTLNLSSLNQGPPPADDCVRIVLSEKGPGATPAPHADVGIIKFDGYKGERNSPTSILFTDGDCNPATSDNEFWGGSSFGHVRGSVRDYSDNEVASFWAWRPSGYDVPIGTDGTVEYVLDWNGTGVETGMPYPCPNCCP